MVKRGGQNFHVRGKAVCIFLASPQSTTEQAELCLWLILILDLADSGGSRSWIECRAQVWCTLHTELLIRPPAST